MRHRIFIFILTSECLSGIAFNNEILLGESHEVSNIYIIMKKPLWHWQDSKCDLRSQSLNANISIATSHCLLQYQRPKSHWFSFKAFFFLQALVSSGLLLYYHSLISSRQACQCSVSLYDCSTAHRWPHTYCLPDLWLHSCYWPFSQKSLSK